MKKLFLLVLLPLFSDAQNWSETIAPIFYNHCTTCHHPGGIAPSSFVEYTDAASDASTIRVRVQQKKMPPWPPDPAYSRFAHERLLTPQEITEIVSWVQNGTPLGDTNLAPPRPVYSGAAEITNPDLIAQIPNYTVNTPTGDLYRCFVIPSGLAANRYITEMEALPGNRSIVHHILIFSDTSSTPVQLDAQDPDPGYTAFGGTGSNTSKLIGLWAPGGNAYRLPAGMGIKLPANGNIILQIHYPAGISGQVDSSQIRFKLTSGFTREVSIDAPLNHFQLDNGPLIIPPNGTPTFTAHYTVPYNISALAVAPHMHLIGRSIRSYAITPTADTIPFIDVPEWDFHWQGLYSFPRVIKLPAGTTLYSSAYYDNTINNPNNPNDPPAWVTLGEETTDEMMLVYFTYTYYLPGDENIVQDSAFFTGVPEGEANRIVQTPQLYDPSPNPAARNCSIRYFLPNRTDVQLSLLDLRGNTVRQFEKQEGLLPGWHGESLELSNVSAGIYFLRMEAGGTVRTKRIIKE